MAHAMAGRGGGPPAFHHAISDKEIAEVLCATCPNQGRCEEDGVACGPEVGLYFVTSDAQAKDLLCSGCPEQVLCHKDGLDCAAQLCKDVQCKDCTFSRVWAGGDWCPGQAG